MEKVKLDFVQNRRKIMPNGNCPECNEFVRSTARGACLNPECPGKKSDQPSVSAEEHMRLLAKDPRQRPVVGGKDFGLNADKTWNPGD